MSNPRNPSLESRMSAVNSHASAMRVHHLESLPSEDLKKHPLWPSVLEWARETPCPVVSWNHHSDFFAAVDALAVLYFAKGQHRRAFNESELLRRAMVGRAYHPGDHAILYHVAGHRLGGAICYAVGKAWQLEQWRKGGVKDFSASLRHDGILPALEAWLRRPDILSDDPFDAKKEIPWVGKLVRSGADDVAAEFFMSALATGLPPGDLWKGIVAADGNAGRDADKLAKNRAAGIKPQVQAEFIGLIEHLWIPLALWCKPKDMILMTLQPDRKSDICAAWEKISRNISKLGFAASWVKNEQ